MSSDECRQVGQTLDVLSEALTEHVDDAMTAAHGDAWDNWLAEKDATRQQGGRKYAVSKNDVSVHLRVIEFEEIEPWRNLRDYMRIKGFVREIRHVRNLKVHEGRCDGESARLRDTSVRLLEALGLEVPDELRENKGEIDVPAELVPTGVSVAPPRVGRIESFFEQLNENGKALFDAYFTNIPAIRNESSMLFGEFLRQLREDGRNYDSISEAYKEKLKSTALKSFEQYKELVKLDSAGAAEHSSANTMLLTALKSEFTEEVMLRMLQFGAIAARPEPDEITEETVAELEELPPLPRGNRAWWLNEVIRTSAELGDTNFVANYLIAEAHMGLAEEVDDKVEALHHLRHAANLWRFEGGLEPGSNAEAMLALTLRLEGKLCNDLGRPEEAIKAFARADEIVDRYPAVGMNLPSA